jgi:hypothetical protein
MGWKAEHPKIADRLDRERVPTARGGMQWYPSTVRAVLTAAAQDG